MSIGDLQLKRLAFFDLELDPFIEVGIRTLPEEHEDEPEGSGGLEIDIVLLSERGTKINAFRGVHGRPLFKGAVALGQEAQGHVEIKLAELPPVCVGLWILAVGSQEWRNKEFDALNVPVEMMVAVSGEPAASGHILATAGDISGSAASIALILRHGNCWTLGSYPLDVIVSPTSPHSPHGRGAGEGWLERCTAARNGAGPTLELGKTRTWERKLPPPKSLSEMIFPQLERPPTSLANAWQDRGSALEELANAKSSAALAQEQLVNSKDSAARAEEERDLALDHVGRLEVQLKASRMESARLSTELEELQRVHEQELRNLEDVQRANIDRLQELHNVLEASNSEREESLKRLQAELSDKEDELEAMRKSLELRDTEIKDEQQLVPNLDVDVRPTFSPRSIPIAQELQKEEAPRKSILHHAEAAWKPVDDAAEVAVQGVGHAAEGATKNIAHGAVASFKIKTEADIMKIQHHAKDEEREKLLASHEEALCKLDFQVTQLKAQLETKEDHYAKLHELHQELVSAGEDQERELEGLHQHLAQKEDRIRELEQKEQELQRLHKHLASKEMRLDELEPLHSQSEWELERLQQHVRELELLSSRQDKELGCLHERLASKDVTIRNLEPSHKQLLDASLEQSLEIQDLHVELKAKRETLSLQHEHVEESAHKLLELERELSDRGCRIANLTSQKEELEKQAHEMHVKVEQLRQDLEASQQELGVRALAIAEAESLVERSAEQASKAQAAANASVKEAREEAEKAARVQELEKEVEEMQEKNEMASKALVTSKLELAQRDKALVDAESLAERTTKELSDRQAAANASLQEVQEEAASNALGLEGEIRELEEQAAASKARLEKSIADMEQQQQLANEERLKDAARANDLEQQVDKMKRAEDEVAQALTESKQELEDKELASVYAEAQAEQEVQHLKAELSAKDKEQWQNRQMHTSQEEAMRKLDMQMARLQAQLAAKDEQYQQLNGLHKALETAGKEQDLAVDRLHGQLVEEVKELEGLKLQLVTHEDMSAQAGVQSQARSRRCEHEIERMQTQLATKDNQLVEMRNLHSQHLGKLEQRQELEHKAVIEEQDREVQRLHKQLAAQDEELKELDVLKLQVLTNEEMSVQVGSEASARTRRLEHEVERMQSQMTNKESQLTEMRQLHMQHLAGEHRQELEHKKEIAKLYSEVAASSDRHSELQDQLEEHDKQYQQLHDQYVAVSPKGRHMHDVLNTFQGMEHLLVDLHSDAEASRFELEEKEEHYRKELEAVIHEKQKKLNEIEEQLQVQASEAKAQSAEHEHAVQDLLAQASARDSQELGTKEKLKETECLLDDLESKLQAEDSKLKELQSELEAEQDRTVEHHTLLTEENVQHAKELESHSEHIEHLQSHLAVSEGQLQEVRNLQMQNASNAVEEQVELQTRLDRKHHEYEHLQEECEVLSSTSQSKQQEVNLLESESLARQHKLNELAIEQETKQDECTTLITASKQKQQENDLLKNRVGLLESQTRSFEEDQSALFADIGKQHKQMVEHLQEQLAVSEEQLSGMANLQLQSTEQEVELHCKLVSEKSQYQELQQECQDAQVQQQIRHLTGNFTAGETTALLQPRVLRSAGGTSMSQHEKLRSLQATGEEEDLAKMSDLESQKLQSQLKLMRRLQAQLLAREHPMAAQKLEQSVERLQTQISTTLELFREQVELIQQRRTDEVGHLQQQLATKADEHEHQRFTHEQTVRRLNLQMGRLQDELANQEQEWQHQRDQLQLATSRKQQKEVERLHAELAIKEDELDHLQKQLATNGGEKKQVQELKVRLQKAEHATQKVRATHDEDLQKAALEEARLHKNHLQLQDHHQQLQDLHEALGMTSKQQQQEIESLQSQLAAQEEQIKDVKSLETQLASERDHCQELERLRAHVASQAEARIRRREQEVAHLRMQLGTTQEQLKEMDVLQKQLTDVAGPKQVASLIAAEADRQQRETQQGPLRAEHAAMLASRRQHEEELHELQARLLISESEQHHQEDELHCLRAAQSKATENTAFHMEQAARLRLLGQNSLQQLEQAILSEREGRRKSRETAVSELQQMQAGLVAKENTAKAQAIQIAQKAHIAETWSQTAEMQMRHIAELRSELAVQGQTAHAQAARIAELQNRITAKGQSSHAHNAHIAHLQHELAKHSETIKQHAQQTAQEQMAWKHEQEGRRKSREAAQQHVEILQSELAAQGLHAEAHTMHIANLETELLAQGHAVQAQTMQIAHLQGLLGMHRQTSGAQAADLAIPFEEELLALTALPAQQQDSTLGSQSEAERRVEKLDATSRSDEADPSRDLQGQSQGSLPDVSRKTSIKHQIDLHSQWHSALGSQGALSISDVGKADDSLDSADKKMGAADSSWCAHAELSAPDISVFGEHRGRNTPDLAGNSQGSGAEHPVGSIVQIRGLPARPSLNEHLAEVLLFDSIQQQYHLRLRTDNSLHHLSASNLCKASAVAPPVKDRFRQEALILDGNKPSTSSQPSKKASPASNAASDVMTDAQFEQAEDPELQLILKEAKRIFKELDRNNNQSISKIELLRGLKASVEVRNFFGLPAHIRQEDAENRRALENVFQGIDRDQSKSLSWTELERWINDVKHLRSQHLSKTPSHAPAPQFPVVEPQDGVWKEFDFTLNHEDPACGPSAQAHPYANVGQAGSISGALDFDFLRRDSHASSGTLKLHGSHEFEQVPGSKSGQISYLQRLEEPQPGQLAVSRPCMDSKRPSVASVASSTGWGRMCTDAQPWPDVRYVALALPSSAESNSDVQSEVPKQDALLPSDGNEGSQAEEQDVRPDLYKLNPLASEPSFGQITSDSGPNSFTDSVPAFASKSGDSLGVKPMMNASGNIIRSTPPPISNSTNLYHWFLPKDPGSAQGVDGEFLGQLDSGASEFGTSCIGNIESGGVTSGSVIWGPSRCTPSPMLMPETSPGIRAPPLGKLLREQLQLPMPTPTFGNAASSGATPGPNMAELSVETAGTASWSGAPAQIQSMPAASSPTRSALAARISEMAVANQYQKGVPGNKMDFAAAWMGGQSATTGNIGAGDAAAGVVYAGNDMSGAMMPFGSGWSTAPLSASGVTAGAAASTTAAAGPRILLRPPRCAEPPLGQQKGEEHC